MNCNQHTENLNQYLDGELEWVLLREFESHTADCRECDAALMRKRELRQALKSMPVQPPETGFYDRVLEQTVRTTHRNETLFWTSAGIGGAVAAGITAWLILALPVNIPENTEQPLLDTVTISLNVERTVRVSFDSVGGLQAATIILQLPPGIEISGYEDRSEIKWAATVHPGKNILELPIVVRSGLGGNIVVQIEHDGKAKSFEFAVTVI